ncbi:MAG TPA: permease prefix domain 1-containing protein [Streptomyces sp.]|uniref:permease prefix domain 1-containing protein n=1 Tax=Streptomyces sp. TaxID=1931 RepID=UPI002B9D7A54|nr:permease prefix domain 1-containing protein [Streptomyces sp.]HWU11675.1 permease prefix domain 1-containing protein [Streptomyces sp.]
MNAAGRPADPVADYEAALRATLHGPREAKARMIEELREGLAETARAHAAEGVPYEQAARLAVRDFGTVEEVAPVCQRELTIAQARHTARTVTLTAPFLIACWFLARTPGPSGTAWQLPRTAQALAVHLAGIAIAAALLAAVTLAATGTLARRLPTPHRLPLVVAWAGTTTSVAMAVATLALALAAALTAHWPLLALAGVLSAASHAVVAASARATRRCARLTLA